MFRTFRMYPLYADSACSDEAECRTYSIGGGIVEPLKLAMSIILRYGRVCTATKNSTRLMVRSMRNWLSAPKVGVVRLLWFNGSLFEEMPYIDTILRPKGIVARLRTDGGPPQKQHPACDTTDRKATFFCPACGRDEPVNGDWILHQVAGGDEYICPECRTVVLTQPRI